MVEFILLVSAGSVVPDSGIDVAEVAREGGLRGR